MAAAAGPSVVPPRARLDRLCQDRSILRPSPGSGGGTVSGRARRLFAVSMLIVLTARGEEKKEPPSVTSVGPNLPSFLTLPSGHSYTLLNTGPLIGKEGKPLGWRISFLSPSSNPRELEASAKELLEFARADLQTASFPAVVIFAVHD